MLHLHTTVPRPARPSRWHAAVAAAARQVLHLRWRHAVECLEQARHDAAHLRGSPLTEAGAARKAARRIAQLESLRTALARELRP